jgi:ATP adenylyltransferase
MDNRILWAPWRSAFVLAKKEKGCPLCRAFEAKRDSIKTLIAHRGETGFVILNKFPYNSGHLMVCPNRHVAELDSLTDQESAEMFSLIRRSVSVLRKVINPHSFNIGMNIGEGSGAGIPEHLHMHIVPRWNGDTSFMMVLGKTKVVSVSLDLVYGKIRKGFREL